MPLAGAPARDTHGATASAVQQLTPARRSSCRRPLLPDRSAPIRPGGRSPPRSAPSPRQSSTACLGITTVRRTRDERATWHCFCWP
eukprot:scaffold1157_cov363-Prasinococcus_capsulatus_cf.AAC.1